MKRLMTISGIFFLATLIVAPIALAGGRGNKGASGECYGDDDGGDTNERGARRGGRGGHRGGKGFSMKRVISQLDLTEEQQEAVMAIRDSHKEATAPNKEKMQSQRDELRTLWAAEFPDRDAILELEDEMLDTRGQMRVAQTDLKLAVMDLLTPQQRSEMSEILEDDESGKGHANGRTRRGQRGKGQERGSCRCDRDDE